MRIKREQRKLILLVEKLRALSVSSAKIQVDPKRKDIYHFPGLELKEMRIDKLEELRSQQTRQESTLKDIDQLVIALFKFKHPAPVSDPERKLGVFSFAKQIGFNRSEARYIIDHAVAQLFPAFSAVAMPTARARNQVVKTIGGVYSLYKLDRNVDFKDGSLMRAAVSIRYPVPYRSSPKDARIRCKISAPPYDLAKANDPSWVYKFDGYMSLAKGSNVYHWMLESRGYPSALLREHKFDKELCFIYTEKLQKIKELGGISGAMGVMLSQNQSTGNVPAVSTIFVVKRAGFGIRGVTKNGSVIADSNKTDPAYYSLCDLERGVITDERQFMRNRPKMIDLEGTLDPEARCAVSRLLRGWSSVNIEGLRT